MKPRPRSHDSPAQGTGASRARQLPAPISQTAANSGFLPTQGPPTHLNLGEPDRSAVQNSVERSPLEMKYPAMCLAITLLWGHPEMDEYFNRFWLADPDSEPIDPDAMADLMLLARLHDCLSPAARATSRATPRRTSDGLSPAAPRSTVPGRPFRW